MNNNSSGGGGKRDNRIGEIIWAKIRGYPWWPGQVPLPIIDFLDQGSSFRPQ